MLRRFEIFLGPRRYRGFIALLAVTGLISLALNAVAAGGEAVRAMQTLLLLVFIIGAAVLIMGRLPLEERNRWLAVIAPSVLVMVIGSIIAPQVAGLFVGAGLGWIVAGIFIFRNIGGPRSYRTAVKAMRKGDFAAAITAMTAQIGEEPERADHYRFRAELHRLSGDLKAARKDYRRMTQLDAESAVAFNGLAEVELQAGRYEEARDAATRAQELAPDEWVAAYNLGMIEERMGEDSEAFRHLTEALGLKIPDSRHRLLVHLYLWRIHERGNERASARDALEALKREKAGLEEWQVIMSAEEAAALRAVLSEDIEQARSLIAGEALAAER